ncbi:uncharacterized protein ASCRUDRAFT_73209 [Ascoidea rubescens DSM 1968]|uniref:Extracellular membrane protein CFEM domain-containing protein n=1 Tax=Ascoidea rubescens DSM 1968 TaxID=1344418 RepID=A0A1D2VNX6_9ASCO|nr:hypothetical protein ASCRUDRAFT_73209 [Ascoidea rubescens DSM 1968]ODV63321.1 hypothetical protein ASCRUDRAFT_73209 [Ascoidea rubescens DSM 1968]
MILLLLLFMFYYLALAITRPPECYNTCINEVGTWCEKHQDDINCLCFNKRSVIGCLQDLCDNSINLQFFQGRDHFTGICLANGIDLTTAPYNTTGEQEAQRFTNTIFSSTLTELKPEPTILNQVSKFVNEEIPISGDKSQIVHVDGNGLEKFKLNTNLLKEKIKSRLGGSEKEKEKEKEQEQEQEEESQDEDEEMYEGIDQLPILNQEDFISKDEINQEILENQKNDNQKYKESETIGFSDAEVSPNYFPIKNQKLNRKPSYPVTIRKVGPTSSNQYILLKKPKQRPDLEITEPIYEAVAVASQNNRNRNRKTNQGYKRKVIRPEISQNLKSSNDFVSQASSVEYNDFSINGENRNSPKNDRKDRKEQNYEEQDKIERKPEAILISSPNQARTKVKANGLPEPPLNIYKKTRHEYNSDGIEINGNPGGGYSGYSGNLGYSGYSNPLKFNDIKRRKLKLLKQIPSRKFQKQTLGTNHPYVSHHMPELM